jgi:hypothetical protein
MNTREIYSINMFSCFKERKQNIIFGMSSFDQTNFSFFPLS